jgi:multidrug resistance efflux pump
MRDDSAFQKDKGLVSERLASGGSEIRDSRMALRGLSRYVDAHDPAAAETALVETVAEPIPPPPNDQETKEHSTQDPGARTLLWRSAKIALASIVALAGIYALLTDQQAVTSDQAIVSAYVSSVRTPIEGNLSGMSVTVGSKVEQGAVIGRIENPRAYDQQLENLTFRREEDQAAARTLGGEISALIKQKKELESRTEAHRAAVGARLERRLWQATELLNAKRLASQQAAVELERSQNLLGVGAVTEADFEQARLANEIAGRELAASEAELAALRVEFDAAAKGVLAEPGVSGDVSYSQQRIDEISVRLADLNASRTSLASRASQTAAQLPIQTSHAELMRRSDIVAPVSGIVWRLDSANGEHVGTGDTLLEIADSSHPFLLVSVPQDRLPDIRLGSTVKFKLSGESQQRTGSVLSITGPGGDGRDRNLSTIIVRDSKKQMAAVMVRLDDTQASASPIGRTARASISASGRNLWSRCLALLF